MKVCIVGAGAIGGLFAAWLARAAAAGVLPQPIALSALARGATLAALRSPGLRLLEAESGSGANAAAAAGAGTLWPIEASDDAAALGVQDLVIVALKGPALPALAPALAQLCGPRTLLLSAMNGVPWWFAEGLPGAPPGLRLDAVDPGGRLRAAVPAAQVIGCVVHLSSTSPAPGVVRHVRGDELIIGRATAVQGAAGADTGRVDGPVDAAVLAVQALLQAAGFAVSTSALIQRELWFKLWGNLTMNPVSALTGAPCDRILDDELVRALCSAMMREADAIGTALGLPIGQEPEQRHAVTRKLGAFKTSMLVDAEQGRPLELDAIIGAVHELGRQLALPTPNIDALFGLVRLMARERGLYPRAVPAGLGRT